MARARAGSGGTLVIRGEAGSGKTALCNAVAERGADVTVVRTRGVEAEATLPYAGLFDLTQPLQRHLGELPDTQAAVLRHVLGQADGGSSPPLRIAAATLALLATAASERPLLVIVDDVQWVDAASVTALLFAFRRLGEEPVVAVVAGRETVGPEWSAVDTLDDVVLGGLDVASATTLVAGLRACDVAHPVAAQLVAATGGNPLAIVEAAALLSPAQLSGTVPIAESSLGTVGERLFAPRVLGLDEAGRRALFLCAATPEGTSRTVLAGLRDLGDGEEALISVEEAGLITLSSGRCSLVHPLVRPAAMASLDPAERRRLHAALARACTSPDERVWHLAAAAVGPDEAVAVGLAEVATRAEQRGGLDEAARAWDRAAELTAVDDERAGRVLGSARCRHLAGRFDDAMPRLDEALACAIAPSLRAEIQQLRGHILLWRGQPAAAHAVLMAEARRLIGIDPFRAAVLALQGVVGSLQATRLVEAEQGAALAAEITAATGGPLADGAAAIHGFTRLLLGDAGGEDAILAARGFLDVIEPLIPQLPMTLVMTSFLGVMFLVVEDVAASRDTLTRTIDHARTLGAVAALPLPLNHLAALELRTGHWLAAAACADEAFDLATETGQASHQLQALVTLGMVEAHRGSGDAGRSHLERAVELASRHGVTSLYAEARTALGLLDLSSGDAAAALAHLVEVDEGAVACGLACPSMIRYLPELVEAALGADDRKLAVSAAQRLEQQASDGRSHWAKAVAERSLALVAQPDDAPLHFERAMKHHAAVDMPFDEARTRLLFGEWLRRRGQRSEARAQLRPAAAVFERLGAAPWAARAREELRATGERVRRVKVSATAALTPQELRIALAVAEGSTNREAGAALFLSPKTVENHLGRIYAKLGVRSRTELAHALHVSS